jgi:nucleotide-binding universal stress UspA family protein
LARAAGARLRIRAVVDDRLPHVAWAPIGGSPPLGGLESLIGGDLSLTAKWDEVLAPKVDSLREDARRAASATGADVEVEAMAGSPPEALMEVSRQVDLLVIGSRRGGRGRSPAARQHRRGADAQRALPGDGRSSRARGVATVSVALGRSARRAATSAGASGSSSRSGVTVGSA